MMPQENRYASNAERQAAYRTRQKTAYARREKERGLPPLPALPTLPGSARWTAAITMAIGLLSATASEMSHYHDERSERWQESERGEEFTERLDEITQIYEQLETLL